MAMTWLNGRLVGDAQASVSLHDAGLLHGMGVFTTLRAYGGKVFAVADHLRRVRRSCQALNIPLNWSDGQLGEAMSQIVFANNLREARVRLTLTPGDSGYPFAESPGTGTAFVTAVALRPYAAELYSSGMNVTSCNTQKLNPYDIQAGHKTINYLSRLAGLRLARSGDAQEALWFDIHDNLVSATMGNVFLVKRGMLHTPATQDELEPAEQGGRICNAMSNVLPGVARKCVLELAKREGISVRVSPLDLGDVMQADEIFMTNSIMEVMPIGRIDGKPAGKGHIGDLTQRLAMLYRYTVDAFVQGAVVALHRSAP